MIFGTINEALEHFGLGKLTGHELKSVYGSTTTGKHVWVPGVPLKDNHINIPYYDKGMNMNLILEQNIEPKHNFPDFITSHIVTRKESNGNYDYDYIGEYKHILFDSTIDFIVRAKVSELPPQSAKSGGATTKSADKKLEWDGSVFPSEDFAREKLDEWKKVVRRM